MPVPEVDFDHHSEEYKRRAPEILAGLRAACPIAHTANFGGMYIVTSHDFVNQVATNHEVFSSRHILGDPAFQGANVPGTAYVFMPGELDPPQHTVFKRLFNPYFTKDEAERWAPRVRFWTGVAIDTAIERGEIDIVLDFADAVSALFTSELVGLPADEWRSWGVPVHDRASLPPDSPRYQEAAAAFAQTVETLVSFAIERRTEPRSDLLTTVAHAEIDGRPLDTDELRSVCTSLIVGGFDTTAALVSNALWHLGRHTDLRLRLIEQPELMGSAIEEYLRFFTPAQGLGRTTTVATEVGGCPIDRHQRVFLSWAGANRDPGLFEDPDEVVLDRSPNHHLAFGAGVHRCIGRHFARMEAAIMVSEFLRRMPDYEVDEARAELFPSIGIINGWVKLPATFSPGVPEQDQRLP